MSTQQIIDAWESGVEPYKSLVAPQPAEAETTVTRQATPRCRTKAEIRADRMSWAIWAAGVYTREVASKRRFPTS